MKCPETNEDSAAVSVLGERIPRRQRATLVRSRFASEEKSFTMPHADRQTSHFHEPQLLHEIHKDVR